MGQSAPAEILQKLTYLVIRHPQVKRVDTVRAYTFGVLYFVEVSGIPFYHGLIEVDLILILFLDTDIFTCAFSLGSGPHTNMRDVGPAILLREVGDYEVEDVLLLVFFLLFRSSLFLAGNLHFYL